MTALPIEMSFKQAQGEMRAMLKLLHAFENVDAVLKAASNAGVAQANADEKIVELQGEIAALKETIAEKRAVATAEQRDAAVEMERLRDVHFAREAKFKAEADESARTRERVATEALTASELFAKQLKTDCATLEATRAELEQKVKAAQGDWDAMRKRMGAD